MSESTVPEGVPTTIADALRATTTTIDDAGVGDTSRLDAELLVGHVAGLDRVGLRVESERTLELEQWRELDALVGRRVTGEPIAYLLGTAWFYGREFAVDPRVLIPRPETELLVELALEHFAEHASGSTFVDACTGSGCVAISIAAELGDRARVIATDISRDALDVASENADRHAARVDFRFGDLLAPLAGDERVDVIVANPPYVEGEDAPGLEAGVREHEPRVALLLPDGEDVASFYGRLARRAHEALVPGGLLALEHGQGQRDAVVQAVAAAGFELVTVHDDLAGIDRVVSAVRGKDRP